MTLLHGASWAMILRTEMFTVEIRINAGHREVYYKDRKKTEQV
jgi:hypothetical protein